ncbi:MAG TPA: ABC transporter ATP-binding protein [Tissierellia bacterium]|nr:ABC transporter ATP-binding protein [Tissierellia bacterium]
MIEIRHLYKSFGKQEVLADVNLTIEDDKIIGLLGRNGVGKTTLLHIIASHLIKREGEVLLDGQQVLENPVRTSQIAYIPEDGFGTDMKLKELFDYGRRLYPNWNEELFQEMIELFGLDVRKKFSKLSRGMRTMTCLTMGLASGARFTLFDEPSLGMDAANRFHFYQKLMSEFEKGGRTFLVSTHIIDEVANLFEEVVILKDKQVMLKEEVPTLLERGFSVRGSREELDAIAFTQRHIGTETFGNSEIRSYYGELPADAKQRIQEAGLDWESLSLQTLFVHLTEGENHVR